MRYIFFSLRPRQWIKNFFIFLPLVFGGKLLAFPENLDIFFTFCLFCVTSGAIYVINDLIDIDKDRLHPIKRLRPIASGKVSIKKASMVAALLLTVSLPVSFIIDLRLGMVLTGYLVFNFLYSIFLKDAVIIDVFCIAFFFFLRVLAGSIVINLEMSHWIIFMVVLLALFLGFNKRRQEITLLTKRAERHRAALKKYNRYFIDQMSAVVTASIVIVYMLYTVDERTVRFFGTNHLIYTIPFVYYGVFRYLYILHDKRWKEGDPTRVILRDGKMQLNIVLWLATSIAVIYFGL